LLILAASSCDNNTPKPIQNAKNMDVMPLMIKAQLMDGGQKPIKDALVSIATGPDSFQDIAASTDAQGFFQLTAGKKSGIYTLSVHHKGNHKSFAIELPQKETLLKLQY
jgi:hypothetical protein